MMQGELVDNNSKTTGESRCRRAGLSLFLLFTLTGSSVYATTGTDIHTLSERAVQTGGKTQVIHEEWVDEERLLRRQIEDLGARLEHIQWQRQKLQVYQRSLEHKIVELEEKSVAMEAINSRLVPILEKNLQRLREGLVTDIPYNMSERRRSLVQAQAVLDDYDMGLLDKTRAVLNAAAREVDLGHQVGVLEDEIEVNGEVRRVKTLHAGRAGLYAITLDHKNAFHWDPGTSSWKEAQSESTAIHKAIEMAEGVRLIELSSLPVYPPVTIEKQEAN